MPLSTFLMRRNAPDLLNTHSLVSDGKISSEPVLWFASCNWSLWHAQEVGRMPPPAIRAHQQHTTMIAQLWNRYRPHVSGSVRQKERFATAKPIFDYIIHFERSTVGGGATVKGGMEDESMERLLAQARRPQREKQTKAMRHWWREMTRIFTVNDPEEGLSWWSGQLSLIVTLGWLMRYLPSQKQHSNDDLHIDDGGGII